MRDSVLKLYIIIGINNIWAEIVIDNPVIAAPVILPKILFAFHVHTCFIMFSICLLNSTIPAVPAYDS